MGRRFSGCVLAALLSVLGAATAAAGGDAEQSFTIYYTSSLNGNLDGCDCKSGPRGGLVKRAAYLRERETDKSLLVDTGDILDVTRDEELSRHVYEVYEELGYDAIAAGDQELSNGIPSFLEAAARYPLISNNLLVIDGGVETAISQGPLIVSKQSLAIGIGALIDKGVFALYPPQVKEALRILDEDQAATAILAAMEERNVRLRVLLYHGSVENALSLSKRVEGFDVIIVGHEQRLVDAQKSGNTIIASPGEDGNRLGALTLTFQKDRISEFSNEFRFFDYVQDPDDPEVRQRIEDYKAFLRAKIKSTS